MGIYFVLPWRLEVCEFMIVCCFPWTLTLVVGVSLTLGGVADCRESVLIEVGISLQSFWVFSRFVL